MLSTEHHREHHRIFRNPWLRAAVLGANDGIISTASLIVGVAAAPSNHDTILISGLAGLVAGSLSMAAGEYVSVQSQADTEAADLKLEQRELKRNSAVELEELIQIYEGRGLTRALAEQVAHQLTAHDALDAHARDELGIWRHNRARPFQAAAASAASFACGAALPVGVAALAPSEQLSFWVVSGSLASLAALGALAAGTGGAAIGMGGIRVAVLGALAMAFTAGVGALFGVAM
jgi:VIT1/CCC1 family predicted Fe2+/Mn2+ transporter